MALKEIREFAAANALDFWVSRFDEALVALEAEKPEIPYNPDIAPLGHLGLGAKQLLAAAMRGWVFGGMGSWNDIWLDDVSRPVYEELTRKLYRAVLQAVVAVANGNKNESLTDDELSRAILAYIWGSPRRPWPSEVPEAVVAEFGEEAVDLLALIHEVFQLLDGLEPEWNETLNQAADRAEAIVRTQHPELHPEAIKAIGNYFAYGFK